MAKEARKATASSGVEPGVESGVEPDATPGGTPSGTPSAMPAGIADDRFDDVAGLSYEQARDELIGVVAELEGGQLGLEESMRLWQRGEALAAHCSTWLDGAEAALSQDEAEQPG